MCVNCYLYNINEITVEAGLEYEYERFSRKLNKYLKRNYGRYYVGLQLYQNNEDSTKFYIIAYYRDLLGIRKADVIIGADISRIYDEVWGTRVQRKSIFAFINYTRIIPRKYRRIF